PSAAIPLGIDQAPMSFLAQNGPPGCTRSTLKPLDTQRKSTIPALMTGIGAYLQRNEGQRVARKVCRRDSNPREGDPSARPGLDAWEPIPYPRVVTHRIAMGVLNMRATILKTCGASIATLALGLSLISTPVMAA